MPLPDTVSGKDSLKVKADFCLVYLVLLCCFLLPFCLSRFLRIFCQCLVPPHLGYHSVSSWSFQGTAGDRAFLLWFENVLSVLGSFWWMIYLIQWPLLGMVTFVPDQGTLIWQKAWDWIEWIVRLRSFGLYFLLLPAVEVTAHSVSEQDDP